MSDTLALGDGRWKLLVAPSLGGSLLACEHDGLPVLQPVAQPVGASRLSSRCCHIPLIPFSNRIENGRFKFEGRSICLASNVDGSPHAMHGHGWQAEWQVTERDAASCALSFQHEPAPDWPWRYQAQQSIAVAGDALHLTLAVENLASTSMPCGLGFHPFLPAAGVARLRFEAAHVWDGNAGAFPRERVDIPAPLDFRAGARVAGRPGTDHCFDGWPGRATIGYEAPARSVLLDGCEATRFLIVYIPAGADYFCLEPVTHAVNAMNLPDATQSGLWTLEPRATREISMTIRCVANKGDAPL